MSNYDTVVIEMLRSIAAILEGTIRFLEKKKEEPKMKPPFKFEVLH